MAMLEGIVQDDGFYSGIFQFQQLLNAVATVFVYRYPCIGEFIFNLIRLVTYLAYIALVIGRSRCLYRDELSEKGKFL